MSLERQSSTLPSPHPTYILRGHSSQIHSVRFVRHNTRLLTGDAQGWVVFWKIETKRALAVWKPHQGPILGTAEWACDKIITHGRDNHLRIWQLRPSDEPNLSTLLPTESTQDDRPKPWLLHTLPVNTLNFCSFSMCYLSAVNAEHAISVNSSDEPILIAVPARDDKKIEVYQFPDEKLKFIIPRVQPTDTGMVMAVKLVHHLASNNLLVLAGYEGGVTALHKLPHNKNGSALKLTQLLYLSQPHTQPILSLDMSPDAKIFYTSSADAVIAAHRVPQLSADTDLADSHASIKEEGSDLNSPQSACQDQASGAHQTRDDMLPSLSSTHHRSPLDSTQATNNPVKPSDNPSESFGFPKEPHSPNSNSAPLSFAKHDILHTNTTPPKPTGLSSLLYSADISRDASPAPPTQPPVVTPQPAYKTVNTKHAGQQSLCVRSDGRLLVTGGWDSRIRIYSSKTLKEVAVLKWHKEGVYAVDFSTILEADHIQQQDDQKSENNDLVKRETGLGKLQRQREEQMQRKHWVAAGAKDGKVSLWEVF